MSVRAKLVEQRLTAYEVKQVEQIAAWKSKPPNLIAELWNLTVLQAAKVVTAVIPETVVRTAIESSYKAARFFAPPRRVARRAGVGDITDLRQRSLEECDRLAQGVINAACIVAMAEGAATGAGGAWSTLLDVPVLFVSALRAIIQMSHCYGYPSDQAADRYFNLGILTVATAGTVAIRLERLDQLQDLADLLVEETQVDVIRSELLSFLFQLELFEDVPGIGIASGTLLNMSFMRRVCVAVRRVFQERWLKDNGKVQAIAPAIGSAPTLRLGGAALPGGQSMRGVIGRRSVSRFLSTWAHHSSGHTPRCAWRAWMVSGWQAAIWKFRGDTQSVAALARQLRVIELRNRPECDRAFDC